MKVIIQPSQLKNYIQAPASKSSMQRACAAALLSNGQTTILNPGHSNDDKAAIEIIKALGANVVINNEQIIINSFGVIPNTNEINCGESGLSIRMFTPIVALSGKQITIKGEGSLTSRPMDFFDEILPQLGVKIKSNNGKLPITIQGPLQPRNIEIDGSLSSQFLTGLLMAYAASPTAPEYESDVINGHVPEPVSIKVNNLKSKPYISLTLDVMKKFKLADHITHKNFEEFYFDRDPMITQTAGGGGTYVVEGDWSGGAFLLVAGAIAGPITVRGLDITSTQADKAIIDAMMTANAGIVMEAKGIKLYPAPMNGFEFDATDSPDLFPPLVVLAAYCNGETKIKGVSRLTHKESNRAVTLQEEFGKMGVKITFNDDIMIIQGGGKLKGATVHSRHDHRIAMALAIAALKAEGQTVIEDAEAVKKSYPDFYNDLESLGASLSLPIQHFKL